MDVQPAEASRSQKSSSIVPEAPPPPSIFHTTRIEHALRTALRAGDTPSPPSFAAAVRHAVFPGGARLRPRLCLAVAAACGDADPHHADAAAAAVELVHCASLVHDDLPCFDAADTRRGQPSVHRAFGEATAVLVGDHLIVLAFEQLARACEVSPRKLPALVTLLARGVGAPQGIIAGQAWEAEPSVDGTLYRRAKTGALFEAAAALGAAAAGASPHAWGVVGSRIGEAYQVADDILDVVGDAARMGKPVGQDAAHGRPNAVNELGLAGARRLLERLVQEAIGAIPSGADPEPVRTWLAEAERRAREVRPASRATSGDRSRAPAPAGVR